MDVFRLRDAVIGDYEHFIRGFLHVRDDTIRETVDPNSEIVYRAGSCSDRERATVSCRHDAWRD